MNTYNKDQEQISDRTNGKFNDINQNMKRLFSTCDMITKNGKVHEEAVSSLNTKVVCLQIMAKSNLNESIKLRSTLQEMTKKKTNSINEGNEYTN